MNICAILDFQTGSAPMDLEPDEEPELLPEDDVRAMIRLLGEVAASQGDHEEKKRILMDGLCALVEAECWTWSLLKNFAPGEQLVISSMMTGGLGSKEMPKLLLALEHPDSSMISAPLAGVVQNREGQVTQRAQDYDPNDFFAVCEGKELWKKAGLGLPLAVCRSVQDDSVSGIGIFRKYDAPPFTARQAKIAHIILTEVGWLHEQGWAWSSAEKVPKLPHRCRLVLNLLLEGMARKQIAAELDLSVHTVNGYAKEIFAFFQVNSHVELIARFRSGKSMPIP